MKLSILLILTAGLIFTGCASNNKNVNMNIEEKPKFQVPKQVTPVVKKKGSLYSRRGASLFSDQKDLQVGDIVTVIIDENYSTSTDNRKTTTKKNEGLSFNPLSITNQKTGDVRSIPGFSLSVGNSERKFTGDAETIANYNVKNTFSVVVQEVYQNGNYLISGNKELLVNGEKIIAKISGVIRPYDIGVNDGIPNSIESEKIANFKFYFDKFGEERDSIEKPWGSKAIETIWPF